MKPRPPLPLERCKPSAGHRAAIALLALATFTLSVPAMAQDDSSAGASLSPFSTRPRSGPPVVPVTSPKAHELIDLQRVDPTFRLDVPYATAKNFTGRQLYSRPRVLLQRPAAEALARVQARLRKQGLGLLLHDGYRPWSVTKLMWDSVPPEKHIFVASPRSGSIHNRGCAIDLSLCDLATGHPIDMGSDFDEMTERSYFDWPQCPRAARRYRDTLRSAMAAEGFHPIKKEWWHFDYKDALRYPVLDIPLEQVP